MNGMFSNLIINRIILHQVFERGEDRTICNPKYSTQLTILDGEGQNVLQDRIINALGNNSHSIEMEISNISESHTFQKLAGLMYKNNDEFIITSKDIAYKLAEAQTSRRIPGGVVVVFDGIIGIPAKKFIGVIKAEIHGGFVLDNSIAAALLMKFLSDLLLTPQQKLYKIGMFIETDTQQTEGLLRRPDEFKAFIYDHNVNNSEVTEAAQYFYETFLGCTISPTHKKLTKDFYTHTKDFINMLVIDDEIKVDLNYALYSYLKTSQSNLVATDDFAGEYIQEQLRDDYINYMEENGFPSRAIIKDISLIKKWLKLRKIKFSSKVSIIAPSDNFHNLVEIVGFSENKTTLRIEGRIEEQQ